MQPLRVFVSREIPTLGIDLLRHQGFSVKVWHEDRPMTQEELIQEAKQADILLSLGENKIDSYFLNECKQVKYFCNLLMQTNVT